VHPQGWLLASLLLLLLPPYPIHTLADTVLLLLLPLLLLLLQSFPKVNAVGVGHSWWRQNFCSGTNSSAINIVTTELSDTLPA
jgi:hypothetical protein